MTARSQTLASIIYLWAAAVLVTPADANAQEPGPFPSIIVAESGPFRLLATPQIAPDGLLATIISVATTNFNHRVVRRAAVEN